MVDLQYNTYNRSLLPLLKKEQIHIIDAFEDLTEEQKKFVDRYFEENVYPVLTPMAVDASRPFPLIRNKTLNIAALLSKRIQRAKNRNWILQRYKFRGSFRDWYRSRQRKKMQNVLFC